jgi:MFS transporter, ACS family, tartrate transporter
VEIGGRSYVPPFLCLAPSLVRGAAAAAAIALVNTVFSLGGFVGPSVVGWFTDATGSPNGALEILAVVAMSAAGLCSVVLRAHRGFNVVRLSGNASGFAS